MIPRGVPLPSAEPVTLDALGYLAGPAGLRLQQQAAAATDLRQQQALRRDHPPAMCRAALALAELRRAAAPRLDGAAAMYFDREGLEMASRSAVARHRAVRLAGHGTVLDLCCGIGGDLVELAARCRAYGVDANPARVRMAQFNCAARGVGVGGLAVADVTVLRLRADVVYIDPARRDARGRHSRTGTAYSPSLGFATALAESVPNVAIRVAPAIDEAELPGGWEVEFVSAAGQCREGVLYRGPVAGARRRATVLPGGHSLTSSPGSAVPVAPPGAYLVDPDPAVVRAHLIDELARVLDAWKLDGQVAYLSTGAPRSTPFGRCYRVLAVRRYELRDLQAYLRREGLRPVAAKRRHFPLAPETVLQRLGRQHGDRPVTLVLTRLADAPSCLICEALA